MASAIVALPLALSAPAAAAAANQSACDGSPLSPQWTGDLEYFTPSTAQMPPPLRGFDYTCAIRIPDIEPGFTILSGFDLLYLDFSREQYERLLGDVAGDGWTYTETATDRGTAIDADNNLLTIEWYDGTATNTFWEGFTTPHLRVGILVNALFPTTGIDDPSVLSGLRTIGDALPTPTQTAVLCGSAIVLTLVIGWPGALLGTVFSARYERLFGWTEKGLPKRIRTALKKTQPRWLVWVGFVAAAIVAGFADPAFGPNLMSLRMLASAFLAFLVFNVVGWAIVKRIVLRLEPTAKPVVNFRWGSLILVLVTVLVARVLEFQPAVIFGLVAGLTYAITLAASRKAVVVLVGSGFALAAALVAWVVFSVLSPVTGDNPALLFVTEFFSGVTIEGVSSLPLALLPFAVLDGGDLFGWKKWVWGIAYALGIAAFMLVLLTIPGSFAAFPGDFARWLILFAIYALLAVGAWAVHGALERRKANAPSRTPER